MALAAGAMLCSVGEQAKADAGGLSSPSAIDRPHRGRLCGKRREVARTARQAEFQASCNNSQMMVAQSMAQTNDVRARTGTNVRNV